MFSASVTSIFLFLHCLFGMNVIRSHQRVFHQFAWMSRFGDTMTLCRRVLHSWIMDHSSSAVKIVTGLQNCNHFTTTPTTTILWLSGLCLVQPRWVSTVVINHPLSASSTYFDPWHPLFSIYVPDSCFPQSFSQVFFGLPLAPFTLYSIHFFTQSLSSFHSTCPYHCYLFCCSTEIMSSNPSLSLNPLLGTLSCSLIAHIHLTILISARWSGTSFSFLSQVSLPCNMLLCTQLLYNLPLNINDHLQCIMLMVMPTPADGIWQAS